LAATCGSSGKASCCASSIVTGTTASTKPPFYRSYDGADYTDKSYPATVSDFRLDTYEITVGRFRKFWSAYPGSMPTAGSGKNPNNASDPGWDAKWNTNALPASQAELTSNITLCDAEYRTWTAGNDNLPMNCLDWYEAEAFCIWDSGRLPTEAEWNYAAAGGTAQRVYPWGSPAPGPNANLTVNGCYYPNGSGNCTGVANIAPVGSIPAGNGLYGQADLAGNVWEWVQDWYVDPYPTSSCNNCAYTTFSAIPCGASSPSGCRAVRGGGYDGGSSVVFSSLRSGLDPSLRVVDYGARCARAR